MKKKKIFALVLAFAVTLSCVGVMAEDEDPEIVDEPIYDDDYLPEYEESYDEINEIVDGFYDDVSVTISLKTENCSVSIDGVDTNTINVDPLTTLNVLILAIPDEGYKFDNWSLTDGTVLSKENPYNMPVASSTDVIAVCVKTEDAAADVQQPTEETETADKEMPNEAETAAKVKYLDVEGHWAKDNIIRAVESGLFSGVSETEFDPDGTTTRGMIITLMARLNGADLSGYTVSAFEDVEISDYYGAAAAWGNENGLVTGTSKTEFDPNGALTREQIAAILFRYAKFVGADTSMSADITGFADYKDVSDYAVEAISWANQAGIINGSDGNRLNPLGTATRAEVATMLVRYSDRLAAEVTENEKEESADAENSGEISDTNAENENKTEESADNVADAENGNETEAEEKSDAE